MNKSISQSINEFFWDLSFSSLFCFPVGQPWSLAWGGVIYIPFEEGNAYYCNFGKGLHPSDWWL
jgi:hypothetical protein